MIHATNITLSYDNKTLVIKDGNFTFKEGEFIFITGSSGSGKSTLLKSLYGELPPVSGNLIVQGIDISKKNRSRLLELRRQTGIVFQDYQLIEDMTASENIRIPLNIKKVPKNKADNQIEKLLAHVNLSSKGDKYPPNLSGGEQQRIAVARALSHNPPLIFADEPTGNLDKYSADIVWDLFKDANQYLGVTIVVVTHTIPQDLDIDYRRFEIDDEGFIYELS